MNYSVIIDGTSVTEKHVLSVSTSEISFDFAGDKLISSKTTIELSNTDYTYDDRPGTGGFFEDENWYNWIVRVYDTDEDVIIWEGRLKKIEIEDGKRIVKLTVNDYVQDMVDTVCVISMLDATPAEVIYAILTDTDYLAIPEDRIILGGFESGEAAQQGTKIDIDINQNDNQKCIAVIEELCKNSCSHIFQRENKIGYWVWSAYHGVLGNTVEDSDILPGSYSQWSDDSQIINSYNIAYKNGASVSYATGSDSGSVTNYGAGKQFSMPSSAVESTAAADFNILYTTQAGAAAIGALVLARYKDIKRMCRFTAGYHLNYINLGDILDLRFSPFTREPVRVISIRPNREKQTIEFECEAVNYPEVYVLNTTAPDAVELITAVQFDNDIHLLWSKCNSTDLMLYKVYFSTVEDYWAGEYCGGLFSPVSVPYNNVAFVETDCFYQFGPVLPGVTYYFRVSCVDLYGNESECSNVVSVTAASASLDLFNMYNLDGNLLQGLTLDMDNPYSGDGLDGWAEYDTAEYDTDVYAPTALYESGAMYKEGGWQAVQYRTLCGNGDIQLQHRYYDGTSWGAWSTAVNADVYGFIDLESEETFQFRVIFNSPGWSDADTLIVKEIS